MFIYIFIQFIGSSAYCMQPRLRATRIARKQPQVGAPLLMAPSGCATKIVCATRLVSNQAYAQLRLGATNKCGQPMRAAMLCPLEVSFAS